MNANKLTARVIYEYLEEKIMTDDYSDGELKLYIDIKKYGSGCLNDKDNKKIFLGLVKECEDIYENGY